MIAGCHLTTFLEFSFGCKVQNVGFAVTHGNMRVNQTFFAQDINLTASRSLIPFSFSCQRSRSQNYAGQDPFPWGRGRGVFH